MMFVLLLWPHYPVAMVPDRWCTDTVVCHYLGILSVAEWTLTIMIILT